MVEFDNSSIKLINMWLPPVSFYHSGRESVASTAYRNDCHKGDARRRVLIKRTIRGQGILYVNGIRYELNAGDAFIIEKPGPYIYCYEGDGAPWEFEFISIQMSSLENLLPPWCANKPIFDLTEQLDLQKSLSEMISDFQLKKFGQLESSSLAYRLYLQIMDRFSKDAAYSKDVRFIKDYLSAHYNEEIMIANICEKLSKTVEAMIRKFKLEIGVSPGQYLLSIRIDEAKLLLRDQSLGLKEIAYRCGFNSLNYFIRVFKNNTGKTPKAFRLLPSF